LLTLLGRNDFAVGKIVQSQTTFIYSLYFSVAPVRSKTLNFHRTLKKNVQIGNSVTADILLNNLAIDREE
jgi:hypothetical protein